MPKDPIMSLLNQTPEPPPPAGAQAFFQALRRLDQLQQEYPQWYSVFEISDPDVCSQAELIRMIETAPNDLALGFLVGKLTLRQQIAAVTGRAFL